MRNIFAQGRHMNSKSIFLREQVYAKDFYKAVSALEEHEGIGEPGELVKPVRCHECKHCKSSVYNLDVDGNSKTAYRCMAQGETNWGLSVSPKHYCSYGELKEDTKH